MFFKKDKKKIVRRAFALDAESSVLSQKGAFTIIIVLIITSFMAVLFLHLNRSVSHFLNMQQREKDKFSRNKIVNIISSSLKNQKACKKTFGEDFGKSAKEVKDLRGKVVLKLDKPIREYKDSGFYEKTGWRPKSLKIIARNPEAVNAKIKNQSCSLPSSGSDDRKSAVLGAEEHKISTLKIYFSRGSEALCSYRPIYTKTDAGSGDLISCSTAEGIIQQFSCPRMTLELICCRYKYKIKFPQETATGASVAEGDDIDIGVRYVSKVRSIDKAAAILRSSLDEEGEDLKTAAWDECEHEKHLARVDGFCHFEHGWKLDTYCDF